MTATTIFDQKTEKAKLIKQYDTLTGNELTHIWKTDRPLYEKLCAAKGIQHSYTVAKDFKETPERFISVDEAQATARFSKEDVRRYYTQSNSGSPDNIGNMQKNDPQGYKLLKMACDVYESLEPAPSQVGRKIRPTEQVVRPTPPEHYQRLQAPPAKVSTESEGTLIGELLGAKFNLPPETKVSFEDYSKLLLFAASVDANKNSEQS
jgi:hypothetical protein